MVVRVASDQFLLVQALDPAIALLGFLQADTGDVELFSAGQGPLLLFRAETDAVETIATLTELEAIETFYKEDPDVDDQYLPPFVVVDDDGHHPAEGSVTLVTVTS